MKKIERGTTKYLIVLIIAIAVFGMILYPLFDFILCNFITNSNFQYSIHQHVIQPILFAFIYGIVYWTVENKKSKK